MYTSVIFTKQFLISNQLSTARFRLLTPAVINKRLMNEIIFSSRVVFFIGGVLNISSGFCGSGGSLMACISSKMLSRMAGSRFTISSSSVSSLKVALPLFWRLINMSKRSCVNVRRSNCLWCFMLTSCLHNIASKQMPWL